MGWRQEQQPPLPRGKSRLSPPQDSRHGQPLVCSGCRNMSCSTAVSKRLAVWNKVMRRSPLCTFQKFILPS